MRGRDPCRKARESAELVARASSTSTPPQLERARAALAERLRAAAAGCYVMGNGGSACDAQHVAVEFQHPIIEKRRALPAHRARAPTPRCSPRSATTATSRRCSPPARAAARASRRRARHLDVRARRPTCIRAHAPRARARRCCTIGVRRPRRRAARRPLRATRSSCRAGRSTGSRRSTPCCCTCCGISPRRAGRARCPLSRRCPRCPLRSGDRSHPARPRQRRQAHRAADRAADRAGVREPGARRARRSGDARRSPAARARVHDRLVRGQRRSSFPGGDIGELAVNGTINDLAMRRRAAARAVARVHPRGGLAARRSRAA